MPSAGEEFLLLRFLCASKKMKPAVGPGPDGFMAARPEFFIAQLRKQERRRL
jgi:hypothetical protein